MDSMEKNVNREGDYKTTVTVRRSTLLDVRELKIAYERQSGRKVTIDDALQFAVATCLPMMRAASTETGLTRPEDGGE